MHEYGLSTADWHQWHVMPQCLYFSTQCCNFLMKVAAVAIQLCHANSPEDVYVPGTKIHPHFVAFLLKLDATTPMWLCPIDAARRNPRIHPIENDGLKHAKNGMHTGYIDNTGQLYILTKTASCDHVTSTLTRTAERVNCAHSWYTSS